MTSDLPRPEYPRPHLRRSRWLNLNGTWEFAFDDEDQGRSKGWESGQTLPASIVVPFSFEAPLSGIGDTSIHPVVWYRRLVDIPAAFLQERLLLHVGASDFETQVWVNGQVAGTHRGGYAPLSCEIQDLARPGENEIVIRVVDRPVWAQPRGKQIIADKPFFIDYDRVTGIWQSVWLEPVSTVFIDDAWSSFDRQRSVLSLGVQTNRECAGEVEAVLSLDGSEVARARTFMQEARARTLEINVPAPRLWSPDAAVLSIPASRTWSKRTPGCDSSRRKTAGCSSTASRSTSVPCSTRGTSRAAGTQHRRTKTCAATSNSCKRWASTERASTRRPRIRAGCTGPTASASWSGEKWRTAVISAPSTSKTSHASGPNSCVATACTRRSWPGFR
jgi:hypothetical protein